MHEHNWIPDIRRHAEELSPAWANMRRHLHQNPELSNHEFQTTQYLVQQFGQLDLPTHVAGDGRGMTADLTLATGKSSGPCLAIRGDIDALPIQDLKTVEYRSRCDGVMHACGHDVHATIVFGAMQILASMRKAGELPWPVSVRAILQPAEELAVGAQYMIQHHALEGIDAILALHVDPTRRVGCVGLRRGTLTAACDTIHLEIQGKGGHGARPHLTNDPIDAVTHWVQSAFRRIARTADPSETVVFSIGKIESGHSVNVIPDHATLAGSLRSLDQDSRRIALETLGDVCECIQRETGCKVDLTLGASAPAVVNDPRLVDLLEDSVGKTLGSEAVEWVDQPSMGSEDFSWYLEHVPGAMLRLGVRGEQAGHEPLHTAAFDVDERALAIGSQVFAAAVINYFDPCNQD